jgi:predicted RNA-binding protein with PUA-like domain
MNHWVVKQEPQTFAWNTFVRAGGTVWTGVRNYQARNHLRAMKRGDLALYYHSGGEKQIVGLARVAREAYADPTAEAGDWSAVDLKPVQALGQPVTLAAIKGDALLRTLPLATNSRLSVSPVAPEQFERLLELAAIRD